MRCPACDKEVKWFYDHVCEAHGWDMERAEHYADVATIINQGERIKT